MPTVSRDRVYRTLWKLQELGLITTLGARRTTVRFDANLDPHLHYVCTRCGLTWDFESTLLSAPQVPNIVNELGSVAGTHVEVHGHSAQSTWPWAPGGVSMRREGIGAHGRRWHLGLGAAGGSARRPRSRPADGRCGGRSVHVEPDTEWSYGPPDRASRLGPPFFSEGRGLSHDPLPQERVRKSSRRLSSVCGWVATLNREIFFTLREAQVLAERWEYNQIRPHSALGYRPPAPETIEPMQLVAAM